MKTKKIWANMAVNDLTRTTRFYTDLGFTSNGIPNEQLTSFKVGEDGFVMHFFLEEVLASNVNMKIADTHTVNEVIFTLSAESKEEADRWAEEVIKAGGTIVSPPEAFGEGYYGFIFADPDGHRFNVFHM